MINLNYHKEMLKTISSLDHKPTLLLHICCAPCSCYPLTVLTKHFDVTLFYSNSNIYPEEEYHKRFNELKRFIKENYPQIKIVEKEYKNEEFTKKLERWKDEKEGSFRCFRCYALRLEDTLEYACKNNFEYVCTVLSVSRFKNSNMINKIGNALNRKYPTTKYLLADFKKEKGTEIGNALSRKYNLYRQQYCGCIYSLENKQKH